MKLPKEAIEAIQKEVNKLNNIEFDKIFGEPLYLYDQVVDSATEALTNPEIYEKAGLVKKESMIVINASKMGEPFMLKLLEELIAKLPNCGYVKKEEQLLQKFIDWAEKEYAKLDAREEYYAPEMDFYDNCIEKVKSLLEQPKQVEETDKQKLVRLSNGQNSNWPERAKERANQPKQVFVNPEQLKQVDGWISVEAEYPTYYEPVLVYDSTSNRVHNAWVASDGDNMFFTVMDSNIVLQNPTHWQPLPNKPK